MENSFEELSKINVSGHTEQKMGMTYLSWPYAIGELMKRDPSAKWSYGEPMRCGNDTLMVFCTVTAFGKERTAQLPVMNHSNKAVSNPDSFAINTAMQRCLVKAIALHGLGLYIYAGEDLPEGEEAPKTPPQKTPPPVAEDRKGATKTLNPREIEKITAKDGSDAAKVTDLSGEVFFLRDPAHIENADMAVKNREKLAVIYDVKGGKNVVTDAIYQANPKK